MQGDQNESGPDEWVNAWTAYKAANTPPLKDEAASNTAPGVAAAVTPAAARTALLPQDQLALDIAEIARRRDTLSALPVGSSVRPALALVPTDRVPAIVGGLLALVILMVFGAAAAMSKLH
jgi:hypothetical protein